MSKIDKDYYLKLGTPIKIIDLKSKNRMVYVYTFKKKLLKGMKYHEKFYRNGNVTYLAFEKSLYEKIIYNNDSDSYFIKCAYALDEFVRNKRIIISITRFIYLLSIIFLLMSKYFTTKNILLISIVYYSVDILLRVGNYIKKIRPVYSKYL